MSRQGMKEREELDFYPTPAWAVWTLIDNAPIDWGDIGDYWLEPACGDGAIVKAFCSHADVKVKEIDWVTIDIADRDFPLTHQMDFMEYKRSMMKRLRSVGLVRDPWFDLAITNPPFSLLDCYIARLRAMARHVLILARLNILETIERNEDFCNDTPDVYVISPRPFADATSYAWFHWYGKPRRKGHLVVLPTWYGGNGHD